MQKPRVLLLEFNELCPVLLERWMESGALPNFELLHRKSQVFTTVADALPPASALDPVVLDPYRARLAQHGVFRLTDGPTRDEPDLWSIVRQSGAPVMCFSSMNVKGFASQGSLYFPDPWCDSEAAYPRQLEPLSRFVAERVREHSNQTRSMGASDYARSRDATYTKRPYPKDSARYRATTPC